MSNQIDVRADSEFQGDSRKAYQSPKLVKLAQNATESGAVTLPIEILGIQGPS